MILVRLSDVEFTDFATPAGVTGLFKCLVAVCLESKMVIQALTLVRDEYTLANIGVEIKKQVDGLFYERTLKRLFISVAEKTGL